MFTGIVEEAGLVERIEPAATSIRLTILSRRCGAGTKIGDSIAVNGCCLTAVNVTGRAGTKRLEFDLLRETWNRTNFPALKPGSAVNLERSLRAADRLGGHFVTGHIDGTGQISRWERSGSDWVLDVKPGADLMPYFIYKGAIAVDGISLTVADVTRNSVRVWIIPHTYEVTTLRERTVGDLVNLEADMLGKYVERFLALQKRRPKRA
jgi:riboflavin synthase